MIPVALAIVASVAAGVWAERRWGGRAATGARSGLVFALYFVLPFIVFFNLTRIELDADLGGGVVLGWVALILAAVLMWLVSRFALALPPPATGSIVTGTLVANTGYLGLPLVVALLGADHLGEAIVYDVAVAAPALLIGGFATGAALGTKAGEGVRERFLAFVTRNPPLLAAFLALLAPDVLAPDVLVDASRALVIALLPLGFFAVGSALAEEADEGALRVPPPLTAPVIAGIVGRLVVAPGLLLLLALPLIDLPPSYLLLAAMPYGVNTITVAHVYGLRIRLTAELLAWTTAIALIVALATVLI
ncbi:MAG: AEC family transporter [Solirubrobacterales bacterium]